MRDWLPEGRDRVRPGGFAAVLIAVALAGGSQFALPKPLAARAITIAPGTITTYAGGGPSQPGPCPSGDGGNATSATMCDPVAVAVDSSGDLFIADGSANVVREVSPSGLITTVAGNGTQGSSGDGGPATAAALNGPAGLAVDSSGNLFIADFR